MNPIRRSPRPATSGGSIAPGQGKTRITIRLDDDLLAWFRDAVKSSNGSYQTAINLALRDYIALEPLEATLRRVIREELARAAGQSSPGTYQESERPRALVADSGAESEYGTSLAGRRSRRRRRRKGE